MNKIKNFLCGFDPQKYIDAQDFHMESIQSELSVGFKESHWIWFVFPQIQGLGTSSMTQHYSLKNKMQASCYLQNEILKSRLIECVNLVLSHKDQKDIKSILGDIDSLKFHSSMTLFSLISKDKNSPFQKALDTFFDGELDELTLTLLK